LGFKPDVTIYTREIFISKQASTQAMYSFAGLAEYAVVPETAAFLLPPILAERLGWVW